MMITLYFSSYRIDAIHYNIIATQNFKHAARRR